MNDTMIEAMSQFEIPRPILRSSVWPRQVSGTGPPGTVCGQCSSLGTACNTLTVALAISW